MALSAQPVLRLSPTASPTLAIGAGRPTALLAPVSNPTLELLPPVGVLAVEVRRALAVVSLTPQGISGPPGKSRYQSYLDTTDDNPVLTEDEWATVDVTQLYSRLTFLEENALIVTSTDW